MINKLPLFMWLFVATYSCSLTSCGNSEEEKPESTSIVGLWREDWGDDPRCDYTAYYFAEDGTGASWDKGNGGERFEYTYDDKRGVIEAVYNEYQKETLKVSDLTVKSVVLDSDTYIKSDLTYNLIILGEWNIHVMKDDSYDSGFTRVRFKYDGTYEAIVDIDDGYGSAELHYSFDSPDFDDRRVYGEYAFKGNDKISITGDPQFKGEYIIDGLVINGMRLIRSETPKAYPHLVGGWHNR